MAGCYYASTEDPSWLPEGVDIMVSDYDPTTEYVIAFAESDGIASYTTRPT